MAHPGAINPVVLNQTHDFMLWYFDSIVPSMDHLVHSFYVILSIGWGLNIFFRILGVRLQRKADELWLLYWPPPIVGTEVVLVNLVREHHLNGVSGCIAVPFSPLTRRTGVKLSKSSAMVYVQWKNLSFSQGSSHRLRNLGNLFRVFFCIVKAILNEFWASRTLRFVAYSVQAVASLSTSTVDSLLAWSFTSFGYDSRTAVLDNSATAHIFNDRDMFISYTSLDPSQTSVATIGEHTTSAAGIGTVRVSWYDDDHTLHTYELPNVLHFPKSTVNLISVTAFGKQFDPRFLEINGKAVCIRTSQFQSVLEWNQSQRTIIHPQSGLPELPLADVDAKRIYSTCVTQCDHICPCHNSNAYSYISASDSSAEAWYGRTINERTGLTATNRVSWADAVRGEKHATKDTPSLSFLQERFLRWHERCNHLSFANMLKLSRKGLLPSEFLKLEHDLPPCGACLFGKQGRRPKRVKTGKPIRQEDHNYPGGGVSTDQIVSTQPGLVPQDAGHLTNERISAATVFVDHFSGYSYVVLMTSTTGEETLRAKQEFEAHAASLGIRVAHYHADNGRFKEAIFMDDVKLNAQTISFCGVNAHHQNGIVERHNRTLTDNARTMLLHAERLWPEAISEILWPFALKYAQHLHNYLSLDAAGLCPHDKFTNADGSILDELDMADFHTFGSPCYVLDSATHNPKWNPRSSLRIFVGFSPHHARNVAMVLNPFTGLVSPQYHIVFDDHFQTLKALRGTSVPDSWTNLCKLNSTLLQDVDPVFQNPALDIESGGDSTVPSVAKDKSMGETEKDTSMGETGTTNPVSNSFVDLASSGLRRSSRNRNKVSSYFSLVDTTQLNPKAMFSKCRQHLLDTIRLDDKCAPIHYTAFFTAAANKCEEVNRLFDGTINKVFEFVFAANQQQNETYTFKDAMLQDDSDAFIKAMVKEISDHEENNHWTMIPRSDMPTSAKTILSIWSFKRKRSPAGELLKHKARLCAHGGMQKWGENYWETYSPTVSWISVRALLAVGIINDLSTSTIDFTLAFPQVDLDIDVFMELPLGCVGPNGDRKGHVLKLNKSLYGLKQASHNWFNYLGDALKGHGFIQSQVDQCVWYKDNIVLLQYVDDLLIIGIDDEIIATFKKELAEGKENFIFTDGGPLESYLGVNVKKHANGTFELSQSFLIEKIINTIVGEEEILHESNVPAVKELLFKDPNGPERKHQFNYRQAIGMLTYLQGTTRPDIAMAVHQCARFSSNPKRSHEKAVIKIVRYLKSTKDKGIFLRPDKSKGIECFVDASFASGWRPDDANDAANVLSRTGYVIYYASCPVHWCSKMQTEIALSTAEAEYIALSQAMRETIPFMRFMTELDVIFPINLPKPKLFCKVFEDNEACISMATSLRFTPRTKHLALKYHHFKSWINKGFLEIVHVPTDQQIADTMTKPLEYLLFKKFRYLICGW